VPHNLGVYWRALQGNPRLVLHAAIYAWAAQLFEPGWVLDVGCEYGFGSVLLAEANPGLGILGCDINIRALVFARGVSQDADVSLCQAAANALPLASDSLSGVCLFNILHLVPDPLAILQEARRVLKGSQCVVVTLPLDDNLPAGWREGSPASRLARLAGHIFEEIDFPDTIVARSPTLPSEEWRLGPEAPILAAVCRKKPRVD
jgi:SAM-dependent methyltransferase